MNEQHLSPIRHITDHRLQCTSADQQTTMKIEGKYGVRKVTLRQESTVIEKNAQQWSKPKPPPVIKNC